MALPTVVLFGEVRKGEENRPSLIRYKRADLSDLKTEETGYGIPTWAQIRGVVKLDEEGSHVCKKGLPISMAVQRLGEMAWSVVEAGWI